MNYLKNRIESRLKHLESLLVDLTSDIKLYKADSTAIRSLALVEGITLRLEHEMAFLRDVCKEFDLYNE